MTPMRRDTPAVVSDWRPGTCMPGVLPLHGLVFSVGSCRQCLQSQKTDINRRVTSN